MPAGAARWRASPDAPWKPWRRRFGTRPEDLHAAIGPGIGKCCYEVGPEVAAHFGAPLETVPGRISTCREANRLQLAAAGLQPERIYCAGLCTMCHPGEFHSFRRDQEAAGRMHSFAGVTGSL